ncbi:SHC-transforming protein 3 isoform X2 [Hippocampus zosterae]|uniref:SHC-transforming protein 3 isoform X2 n=1 Tax=Hippocampus zosterae TaxID=109293 RepID=UPI00223D19DF|nr:SHC-transforming protein 3 isoform X2 [Hippocampus zosterae]
MLHRTKYNRFRNESVTSVDDIVHGLSMNPKVSASSETPYTPPADVQPVAASNTPSAPAAAAGHDHSDDGGTPLCTLINKVSNLKFSNSGSLLGIKGLSSAVKDLAVAKLQGGSGASLGVVAPGAAACLSTPEPAVGMSKKSRLDELPLAGEDWNLGCSGPVGKPFRGWLHSSEKISGPGVTYIVKYLGCIEVLRSMRSLDFTTRSQITREAISLVCEAVPPTKGALRKRKPPSKALSNILGKSNLQFAGMSINLNISTSSLNLMTPDCKQIIANHHMQSISFASGGDPDTTDFVAYVAKDPVNRRACHILECSDGLAQDVIGTIGQAFDLRFQQYMQCPSSKPSTTHDRVFNVEELPWTEDEEESAEHPYYNSVPGKMPPPGGFIDARQTNPNAPSDGSQMGTNSVDQNYYQGRHCGENWTEERKSIFIQQGSLDQSSESKGPVTKADEMPTYMNTQQIDEQVLAALQAEAEHVTKGMAATARENPPTDLFDMKPFEDALQSQPQAPSQLSALHKATSVDNSSPLLARSIAFRVQEELEGQAWYRGKMSRRAAEKLLHDDGDFLVRKSATNPGSYVLTGMHNGIAKHLLLVDPEGTVRTKDHVFDSISHLIGHHRDNNLPIVSAGSELCLLQPVVWKQ